MKDIVIRGQLGVAVQRDEHCVVCVMRPSPRRGETEHNTIVRSAQVDTVRTMSRSRRRIMEYNAKKSRA